MLLNQPKIIRLIKNVTIHKTILLLSLIFISVQLHAQNKKDYLSAKESEPSNFEWKQDFPPSADKTLHTWDGSFFEFPAIRWSVVHMRAMLPTINVSCGLGAPEPLQYNLDEHIDDLTFTPWESKKKMTWEFASHPVAANAANDATSLPAYQAVADYLMEK